MKEITVQQRQVPKVLVADGVPETLGRILGARGIRSANELDLGLKNLLPPNNLQGIDQAAELLAEAVTANASIVIVGDFDADGATSCALAVKCLKAFGMSEVSYLVPNRFEYGYGLSPEIVGVAAVRQPDIIITVDNGISSIDGVLAANELGITVLITDHHLPGEEIPQADVIVNPNLPNDKFASKNLAGVGVIFYVLLATRAKLRALGWFSQSQVDEPNMSQFLDLVALGTVADVVPLDRNNRILVQQGLQRIRSNQACCGIRALLDVAQRNFANISASDLGFAVGPRLNAAGRLDDISVGIECLISDNDEHARELAQQLDSLNRERRQVEATMQRNALEEVDKLNLESNQSSAPKIYCLYDKSWHQGVVGLVASRIKERVHRPVVAFAPSEESSENVDELKGSCRSIEGIHIRDLLARVDALNPGLISKFGGHAMAAGLTIKVQKLEAFQKALEAVADEFTKGFSWDRVILTDGQLQAADYTQSFAEQLKQISPWGQAFPEPVFEGEFKVIDAREVGDGHLKMQVQPLASTQIIDAICFGYLSDGADFPQDVIYMIYRLDINEFRGKRSLQFMVDRIVDSKA